MQNFQDTFETCKRSFIGAFRICVTVPLILKFVTLQAVEQIVTIHILSNISRSQGNQTIKFG